MKNISHWLKVAVIGIALGFALQFVRAWTEPATTPPGGNVGAPINTGSQAQTKTGAIYSNDRVGAPYLCIGTDCRNAWPSGTTTDPAPAPAPAPAPCLCNTDPFGGGSVYACGSTFDYCAGSGIWCYCLARCDSPNSWTMGLPAGGTQDGFACP